MSRPRILLVYRVDSPFILADRDLLGRHFDVIEFDWRQHPHPARALAWWMVRHRKEFDLAFFWFGAGHATVGTRVARLLRKPSVIQVGGFDVSDIPDYGFLSRPRQLRWARGHFHRASRILVVSEALLRTVVARFPDAAPRALVLPTGVDVERFRPEGSRMPRVLSVAPADTWPRAHIKGVDRVAAVARAMPEIPFLLIGVAPEIAPRIQRPANLEVRGHVSQADLVPEYQASAVYLQASRSEGMPNAVMEAMACGCVPVVTAVGGMPELVADTGFVVPVAGDLVSAIRKALVAGARGELARARVVARFSTRQREEGLVRLFKELL